MSNHDFRKYGITSENWSKETLEGLLGIIQFADMSRIY